MSNSKELRLEASSLKPLRLEEMIERITIKKKKKKKDDVQLTNSKAVVQVPSDDLSVSWNLR